MDRYQGNTTIHPVGALESAAICCGIGALAGAGTFALLLALAGWTFLQAVFAGFIVAAVLVVLLLLTVGRVRKPATEDIKAAGEGQTSDAPTPREPSDLMRPRNVNKPSPHRSEIPHSMISDTKGEVPLNDPKVNKIPGAPEGNVPLVTGAAPAAAAAAAPAPASKVEAASKPKPAPEPAPTPAPKAESAPTPAAAAPGEGTKPATLDKARNGKGDDLKKIKGVGPKLEKLCNELGFYHFDQIAAWTPAEVAWVDDNLQGFKGRVSRDDWVDQAKLLAAGGDTDFSKKVDKGGVY